jgi:basic membrane protein A and related proteins
MRKFTTRKIFAMFMVFGLTMTTLVSCDTTNDQKDDSNKETASVESNPEEADSKDELVVAFIYDGEIGDGGYTQAHDDARLMVEEVEGVSTLYIESVSEDTAQVQKVCEDFIAQGAKVIFGTSFGFQDGMLASAQRHPEVVYEHFSGYYSADNYGTYFGKIYQMRYLAGIVAGMQTETNKIGYVAAFAIPEVIRGIDAFALGVKSVNKDATVEVNWTSTWNDAAKEKDAAVALVDKKCDVIAQHQNTTGAQSAAEEAGVWGIGYNKDMSYAAPKATLTAPIWNTGEYAVKVIEEVLAGTWKAASYFGPASDEVVDLSPLTENVKEGIAEVVEAKKAEILANGNDDGIFVGPLSDNEGNLVVEEGKVMNDEELLSMMWLVDNVIGSTK